MTSIEKFRQLKFAPLTPNEEASFWNIVDIKFGGNGCWEWSSSPDKSGYCRFKVDGKRYLVHRIAYALCRGPVPSGSLVCHKCDNRKCVRPDHLFLGNHKQNTGDMFAKGRGRSGERSSFAKLTEEAVKEILCSKEIARVVAKRFGVSKSCVGKIRTRQNWKHVQPTRDESAE